MIHFTSGQVWFRHERVRAPHESWTNVKDGYVAASSTEAAHATRPCLLGLDPSRQSWITLEGWKVEMEKS